MELRLPDRPDATAVQKMGRTFFELIAKVANNPGITGDISPIDVATQFEMWRKMLQRAGAPGAAVLALLGSNFKTVHGKNMNKLIEWTADNIHCAVALYTDVRTHTALPNNKQAKRNTLNGPSGGPSGASGSDPGPSAAPANSEQHKGKTVFKCYACGGDHQARFCTDKGKKDAWDSGATARKAASLLDGTASAKVRQGGQGRGRGGGRGGSGSGYRGRGASGK